MTTPETAGDSDERIDEMTAGQEHAERRAAQAAAARKHENRARKRKRPGKGNRSDWKREV